MTTPEMKEKETETTLARLQRELDEINLTQPAYFVIPPGTTTQPIGDLPPELLRYWQLICLKEEVRNEFKLGMRMAKEEWKPVLENVDKESLREFLEKMVEFSDDIIEIEGDIILLWRLFLHDANEHFENGEMENATPARRHWLVVDKTLCTSSVPPSWGEDIKTVLVSSDVLDLLGFGEE